MAMARMSASSCRPRVSFFRRSKGSTSQIHSITAAPITYRDQVRWVRRKRFNTPQHTATETSTVDSRMARWMRETGGTSLRSVGKGFGLV